MGEREAGTLGLLFRFPYTRGQILYGKAIGRFAAAVPLTANLLVSLMLAAVLYDRAVPGRFALLVVATVLFVAVFVRFAVSVSALSRSPVRVVVAVVVAFVLFLFLWDVVPAAVYFFVHGSLPGTNARPGYVLVNRLNPVTSCLAVLTAALPTLATSDAAGESVYRSGWLVELILLGWSTVAVVASYARFWVADLT